MGGRPVGIPKTGGRTKGTPNKVSSEIKTLARQYGPEAIEKLVRLMRGPDEQADELSAKLIEIKPDSDKGADLIRQLVTLLAGRMVGTELSAARELLDRGFGKAPQPMTGEDGTGPATIRIARIIVDPGEKTAG